MKPWRLRTLVSLAAVAFSAVAAWSVPMLDLPGDEVRAQELPPPPPSDTTHESVNQRVSTWLSPSIEEQLSNDGELLTVGKGALFVPSFSEPRREPEIGIYSPSGKLIKTGQTGTRILLDSGNYEIKVGSGSQRQQINTLTHVEEGHTQVINPTWSGLLVETLTADGLYIEGQYEVQRLDRNGWYGRGRGLAEERLQDVKVWLLPPGTYRIGKVGDAIGSLRNYITVELHMGEMQVVELVYDKPDNGEIIAGGLKTLSTRTHVGRNWTFGLRAGGNLSLSQEVDESDAHKRAIQFAGDVRTRARYDRSKYFGVNELFMQTGVVKDKDAPLLVQTDNLQVRSTWVRRFNTWIGPYIRGQATTHLFPSRSTSDTVYIVRDIPDPLNSSQTKKDTIETDITKRFRIQPPFYPVKLVEGAGVNLELLSGSFIELATQIGMGANQSISNGDYLPLSDKIFELAENTSEIGAEGIVNAKVRLFSAFTVDFRLELFAPNANITRPRLQDLETDCRLSISRFIELGYLFQMHQTDKKVANRFPFSNSLSLRLNVNY